MPKLIHSDFEEPQPATQAQSLGDILFGEGAKRESARQADLRVKQKEQAYTNALAAFNAGDMMELGAQSYRAGADPGPILGYLKYYKPGGGRGSMQGAGQSDVDAWQRR